MVDKIISAETDAVIIVDVQNDFCPGGALAVPKGDEVVDTANRLMRKFQQVIVTQDFHPVGHKSFASSHPSKKPFEIISMHYGEQVLWPDHCIAGTKGCDFHARLETSNANMIIRKGKNLDIDSYSTFFENDHKTSTGLETYLRNVGVTRVFLAGLATDFCVLYSALDALALGFETCVIEDGCRGINLEGSLTAAHQKMDEAGVERILEADMK